MKKVICVVEDEKDLCELVKSYLEKEGYEVRAYYTYESAYEHTEDDDVHLWLLDIMLDEKSGFDLLEAIRRHSKDVPIVFMSARDKEFDRIIGLEKGSDDYITKPFSMKEMVLRVNNVIKRTYRDDLKILVDGYEIDDSQRKVFKDGEPIAVTTLEYDLLILFVKNKGKPFTRDQILMRVWGTDYFGSNRVVDDTLRRLRRKMPDLNIHTIYRYGYRLD
ncbi:MAG: response regulator transcription factor [Erysipelotrichales bacterium]|nr:response regulator transcription factor [Erysipelotrichales bacterium]MBQ1385418.1 response regulator transcription factor [Erysipelotrichales bacterium]MBQ2309625.1 response regulator transcription factor [Erysipelotrichales bacterium]MBQ2479221.1 response regulator transcription factor [Erysipelotrichales bacterium]MBQ4375092.1 response regulator transcription factor [Erysipelotrichales bacterium]